MNYTTKFSNPLNQASGCIIVPVFKDTKLGETGTCADEAGGGVISAALERGDIKGQIGDSLLFPHIEGIRPDRLLLIGCGKTENGLNIQDLGKIGAAITTAIGKSGAVDASLALEGIALKESSKADTVSCLIEALEYNSYRFDRLKQEKSPSALKSVRIHVVNRAAVNAAQTGVERGVAIANGVRMARDLGNLPGNICTPSHLAEQARDLHKSHGLKVTVLDEGRMQKLGMGSLLSVSRGSREPARLITMEYKGGPKNQKPIVLVGKGLTFDAGGISLKPAAAMDEMKYDMCGSASVFGTLLAVSELKLPVNVVGIVPSCENLPDGAANKPGDIVTSMSGKTIEILNTDAEGRLILCDAITYARRYKPHTVIDIATLTGACVVALGAHPSGLFTSSDILAKQIQDAGEQSGDRTWRLPLWDDYQEQIDSPFADMANVGGRYAGAVTAACFLARFTDGLNWAHLDIAGTAWNSGKNKSATGRPVSMLTRFLINHSQTVRGR